MSEENSDTFEPLSQAEVDAVECEIVGDNSGGFEGHGQGDRAPAAKPEFIGAEKCAGLCSALSDMIAGRKGDKWKLKPEESKSLGEALDPVLAKYMPESGEDFSAEFSLTLVAFAIIVPRMNAASE